MKHKLIIAICLAVASALIGASPAAAQIIHDAEFVKLQSQHGEKWSQQDKTLDKRLAELEAKFTHRCALYHRKMMVEHGSDQQGRADISGFPSF